MHDIFNNHTIGAAFEYIADLGRGEFAKVVQIRHKESGNKFALKVIHVVEASKINPAKEYELHNACKHPSVVSCYDIMHGSSITCMVLELLEGGNLKDHLIDKGALRNDGTNLFLKSLLEGLGYIHAKGLAHRDVKPDNIFIRYRDTDIETFKLGDFGCTRHARLYTECTTWRGTYLYP